MRCAVVAAVFTCIASGAQAQTYPNRVIRFVVATAPGGGSDLIARTLAPKLGAVLGQQIVVDNRVGAGGRIGAELVAKAAPDGHTLLIGTGSLMVIAPALHTRLSYDMPKDFAPVTQLGFAPYVLVTHPSVPAKTVKELIAIARARPGRLTYASAGSGSSAHLAAELFGTEANLKMVHVPYRAGQYATLSVIAGESDLMFSNLIQALPGIRSGRLRPLGISSLKRSTLLPDVATIEETGLPGFQVEQLYGMLAPAGTPRDIIRRLNEETAKVMHSADTRNKLVADGTEVIVSSPEAFEKVLVTEIAKWAKVIKAANVKAE